MSRLDLNNVRETRKGTLAGLDHLHLGDSHHARGEGQVSLPVRSHVAVMSWLWAR